MREIKFRAYYIPEKTMIGWDGIRETQFFDKRNNPLQSTSDWKVMQYTGLKDKNGVEIFEGDILHYRMGRTNLYHLIEWQADRGSWLLPHPLDNFQIIGNIYENKELLT